MLSCLFLFVILCIFVAHTPDNSFMGFVVEQHLKDPVLPSINKKNQAVVYGKNELMWKVSFFFILFLLNFHLD